MLVDGRLALECNLPPLIGDCPTTCEDLDEDGLTDAWEEIVIDRFRPLRRLDEAESYTNDDDATVGDVGRVAVGPVDGYRVFVMLGWSHDYGSCGGFTAHNGDSERIALDLEPYPDGGPGGVIVRGAYTAAHEGSINDSGRTFTGDDLGLLQFDADTETAEPRWVVFPSADKHATYGSIEICENISKLPCVDEDCAEGEDLLPDFVHAGEDDARIVDDLTDIGFPGDFAWTDQDFCGGQGGLICSSPVREKLLVDPF